MAARRNRMSRRRGFTLIELLTVMAIIAILMAITFPVIASVMQAGKKTGCMENMRQIIQAATLFKEDNGYYPEALYGYDDFTGQQVVERRFLFPQYIKNRSDFTCPASEWKAPNVEGDATRGIPRQDDDLCMTRAVAQDSTTGQPALTQHFYYPWDSYDMQILATRRSDPNTGTIKCGTPAAPFIGGSQAYNLPSTNHIGYLVYQRAWYFPLPADPNQPPDPRQLLFRTPSEQTVVTWCLNHTRAKVIDPATRTIQLEEGAMALVGFLDGRVQYLPATRMAVWDNADGHTWRVTAKP